MLYLIKIYVVIITAIIVYYLLAFLNTSKIDMVAEMDKSYFLIQFNLQKYQKCTRTRKFLDGSANIT